METNITMDWLSSNGEIYHRNCVHWTASIECGKCERCGGEIPERIVRLAQSQRADRERRIRDRDAQRSLKTI